MPKPQKLRDLKFKKYPFWRIDKRNLQIINGGWHFSFLQNQRILQKIQSYSHGEFNTKENVNLDKINLKIKNNMDIFDRGYKLQKIDIDSSFPEYIYKNKKLLKDWVI